MKVRICVSKSRRPVTVFASTSGLCFSHSADVLEGRVVGVADGDTHRARSEQNSFRTLLSVGLLNKLRYQVKYVFASQESLT
jgi:hypothetical protein